MRRFVCLVIILSSLFFSINSSTRFVGVVKNGDLLTINGGAKDGIEHGMTGRVKILYKHGSYYDVGLFKVISVSQKRSELRITDFDENANLSEVSAAEFDDTLDPQAYQQKRLAELKKKWVKDLKAGKIKSAKAVLKEALQISPGNDEVTQLLQGINLIELPEIPVQDYLRYKFKNPNPLVFNIIKNRIYELYPNFPPDEELDKGGFNDKGYFEVTFDNAHTMIYIPENKIFVDKYEVSESQFMGTANDKLPHLTSYDEAVKYCDAKNLRLPTEDEWETIAGKHKGNEYSWGTEEVDAGGIYRANYRAFEKEDGYTYRAPARSFEQFASPYGIVNLSGNAWEWVKEGICKGGGYMSGKEDLKISSRSESQEKAGFRCVWEILR
jgi:hypothetical protein